jgi:hypothetical protein
MYKKGGLVIGSGGFGCVFHPELECKNENVYEKSKKNYITKLLIKKYAEEEYYNILKYKSILQSIPNYSAYFFLKDISICKPKTLTEKDLYNFNNKCNALKKTNITKKNINKNLNKLLAIQMPYGGIDVGVFVSLENYDSYIHLNNSLIKLLENGIIPMNKNGVYHCDLKDSNILVYTEDNSFYTKIIDWGLSMHIKDKHVIPEIITNRPFQFNVPFSVVLLNGFFYEMYNNFLKNNTNFSYENTKNFVKRYLQVFIDNEGSGHYSIFVSWLKKINLKKKDLNNIPYFLFDLSIFSKNIPDEISDYLTNILIKYTKDGTFYLIDYFSNVFLNNVDIWGFCMIYLAFYDELNNNYNKLIKAEYEMLNILNELFSLIISASTEKIDVSKVIEKCNQLNKYFNEAYKKSQIKKQKKTQNLLNSYQKRKKIYSFPEENREIIKSLTSKSSLKSTFSKNTSTRKGGKGKTYDRRKFLYKTQKIRYAKI